MRKILQAYIDPAVKEYLVEQMAEIVRNEIAGQTSYCDIGDGCPHGW